MPIKAYKYRIYPTKAQIKKFEQTLDICCELYNAALQERREAWRLARKAVSYFDQTKELTELKKIRDDLKTVHSQALENVLKRLDWAFDGFFRRVTTGQRPGFPRFRSSFDSVTFRGNSFGFIGGKLRLSKVGNVKIKLHRSIKGKAKTVTIKRSYTGKWYAGFVVEAETTPLEPSSEHVGIDCGLEKFATLSTGESIANPRFFLKEEKALARASRKVSHAAKRSRERARCRKVTSRIYEKLSNRRRNFAHQLSRKLANRYGLIVFENLDILDMLRNKQLSKSISDVSWNQFITFTTYKAEWAGRRVVIVAPRNTSKMCSGCGEIVEKDLSIRVHDCPSCGLKMDRDHNAAINILRLGQQSLGASDT